MKYCPACSKELQKRPSEPWTTTNRCNPCRKDYITYHGDAMGGSNDVTQIKDISKEGFV